MHTMKKEIDDLYFLEVTSKYIILNDSYSGIIIMDFDLNKVNNIELDDDIVIDFSVKHNDEVILFCYENECAFYVNLENNNNFRFDLSDYSDIYFSNIYFWNQDKVYLFADSGEIAVIIDLNIGVANRVATSDIDGVNLKKKYSELISKDIISYDNDKRSVLIVTGTNYYILHTDSKIAMDTHITALNQNKNELSSDQIYCKTRYSQDTVICVSEKNIVVLKEEKEKFIYPPYETYRFFEGKYVERNGEKTLLALCNDNSSEESSLLMKYDDLD